MDQIWPNLTKWVMDRQQNSPMDLPTVKPRRGTAIEKTDMTNGRRSNGRINPSSPRWPTTQNIRQPIRIERLGFGKKWDFPWFSILILNVWGPQCLDLQHWTKLQSRVLAEKSRISATWTSSILNTQSSSECRSTCWLFWSGSKAWERVKDETTTRCQVAKICRSNSKYKYINIITVLESTMIRYNTIPCKAQSHTLRIS